jgi:hypothetical protein
MKDQKRKEKQDANARCKNRDTILILKKRDAILR